MLIVKYRDPAALKRNRANSRVHTDKQVRQVARSIKAYGFLSPVLVDENDVIVAGHCPVDAAKLIGLTSIPTIRPAAAPELSQPTGSYPNAGTLNRRARDCAMHVASDLGDIQKGGDRPFTSGLALEP